jgi:lysophospholipase L1-like esterase
MKLRRLSTAVLLVLVVPALSTAQRAAPSALPAAVSAAHWIPTWATAQELVRFPPPPGAPSIGPTPASAAPAGTPGTAPISLQTVNNQTIRMFARTSIGGKRVRVKLANALLATRVEIGEAHIALRDKDSAIAAGSDRKLTFGGTGAIMIAPGAVVVSDPVDLAVPPLTDVAISLFFPGETGPPTTHARGLKTTYIAGPGDFTAAAAMPGAAETRLSFYWLAAIEVEAPAGTPLIVAFGDSITDGSQSTSDTNSPWPAVLATRLAADKSTAHIAIVNEGIGGNRMLSDGTLFQGVSALARLDRDVLNQPGVKWMIMLEGINDIGNGTAQLTTAPTVTAADLIWAYRQVIARAHTQGIKVIGATLTPFEGANYFREEGEKIRQAVNDWIRTSKEYDAVIDFDAVVRDPANPRRIKPEFDPGDHLHPNDAGYKAMATAVDLKIFR